MNPERLRKDLEHRRRSGQRKTWDFGWFERLHAFKVKRADPTWPWATLAEMVADIETEVNAMKLHNILPQGAASAVAAAAKSQRAAELAKKVQLEVAQRKEAFERSILKSIDDHAAVLPEKAVKLCDLYLVKFPKSGIRTEVEKVKADCLSFIAYKRRIAAEEARESVKRNLTRQGLVRVDSLPREWSRA